MVIWVKNMEWISEFDKDKNYNFKYLNLLSEKYPSIQSVCREIINLSAILNLPKGTEHFMSDIHGEYEAFCHILNNCSGVIKEKVDMIFSDRLSKTERKELCTLIYYPEEKMELLSKEHKITDYWYGMTLNLLIELSKYLSSKYTRSKVRKALPKDFSYIIDELLHAQSDEDEDKHMYHKKIVDTIIKINNAREFIIELTKLIKRLAVDKLHIVGDIFDRGKNPDKIIDLLMDYHNVDVQWGNHDILWMGAAAGNDACIAVALRNNIKYNNMEILENSYGISLRNLSDFAKKTYDYLDEKDAMVMAVSIIMFKLEGQLIKNHPEYEMDKYLLLDKVNIDDASIEIEGKKYKISARHFKTLIKDDPYELTDSEKQVVDELKEYFLSSTSLQKHVEFLYENGSIYKCNNDNLLFHGCIPLNDDGNFFIVNKGGKVLKGKSYLDYCDKMARRAYFDNNKEGIDFMWYLWCSDKSPLFGRKITTFQSTFLEDEKTWIEEKNPYYKYYTREKTCHMIMAEFGLYSNNSHIINGHTPVKVSCGESPLKANNKLIVIDGGFCKSYHKKTGIAGYTLISNSHGMRLKAHDSFESVEKVLIENKDIESTSDIFETAPKRIRVKDTDNGIRISENIMDLQMLLGAYRNGLIVPKVN